MQRPCPMGLLSDAPLWPGSVLHSGPRCAAAWNLGLPRPFSWARLSPPFTTGCVQLAGVIVWDQSHDGTCPPVPQWDGAVSVTLRRCPWECEDGIWLFAAGPCVDVLGGVVAVPMESLCPADRVACVLRPSLQRFVPPCSTARFAGQEWLLLCQGLRELLCATFMHFLPSCLPAHPLPACPPVPFQAQLADHKGSVLRSVFKNSVGRHAPAFQMDGTVLGVRAAWA